MISVTEVTGGGVGDNRGYNLTIGGRGWVKGQDMRLGS